MIYLQTFGIAFMAMLGIEVALGLCIALGNTKRGASKYDEDNSI